MPRYSSQKTKILYILELLQRESNENHQVSMDRILSHLEANGIHAERKSIYSDVEVLRQMGYKIEQKKGKYAGYYLKEGQFELGELKLLVDAVQASRFITGKKSLELIRKLEGLTNKYAASELHREVIVAGKVKSMNESIFENVNQIYQAIQENHSLAFHYVGWNVKKQLVLRHEGAQYQVSPWSLLWTDENYYLIGYDEQAEKIKYYRVDKMRDVNIGNAERKGKDVFDEIDMSQFAKRTFGMFAGEDREIVLCCKNEVAGVILDRFGADIPMYPDKEGFFICHVKAQVSKQFFGWVAGIGEEVKIVAPSDVKEQYQQFLMGLVVHFFEEEKLEG